MGRPVAALVTNDTKPEQSVPLGESPPLTYGVPDIELTSVNSVTVANMQTDVSSGFCNMPKSVTTFTPFAVTPLTMADIQGLVH